VVIADQAGVLGLGGIVGGQSSGVDDDTSDVYLECALFDPIAIAETGRALQILSDARYRFERGVDPLFARDAVELATAMIVEICGGTVSDVAVAGAVPDHGRQIAYRPSRCLDLGGVHVAEDRQAEILTALGCQVTKNTPWQVVPPSWRGDIHGESDLVEEILRVSGYHQIPSTPLDRDGVIAKPALSPARRRLARLRRGSTQRGFYEAVTWSFTAAPIAALFTDARPDLVLLNPISTDLNTIRSTILASLLPVAVKNIDRGLGDVALMEIGPAFRNATPDGQDMMATGLRIGAASPRHWQGGHRPVDVYDVKADALSVLEMAGTPVENLQITPDAPGYYHPGRSACLRLGKEILGYFGELHPQISEHFGVTSRIVAFEIFVDRLPLPRKNSGPARPLLKISPLQPVRRDFAFVVAQDLPADKVVRAIMAADKNLIQQVDIFDVYRGPGVADGFQSLALAITLQPQDQTLSDQQLEALSLQVVAAVAHIGGKLRS